MDFSEYQIKARATAMYPDNYRIIYPALGLASEAGEVCGKIKKMFRDGLPYEEVREVVKKELGDCLWYCSVLAGDFHLTLDEVARYNIQKLASRKERGVITGSGDDR